LLTQKLCKLWPRLAAVAKLSFSVSLRLAHGLLRLALRLLTTLLLLVVALVEVLAKMLAEVEQVDFVQAQG
jgi:hypothetical protein